MTSLEFHARSARANNALINSCPDKSYKECMVAIKCLDASSSDDISSGSLEESSIVQTTLKSLYLCAQIISQS